MLALSKYPLVIYFRSKPVFIVVSAQHKCTYVSNVCVVNFKTVFAFAKSHNASIIQARQSSVNDVSECQGKICAREYDFF